MTDRLTVEILGHQESRVIHVGEQVLVRLLWSGPEFEQCRAHIELERCCTSPEGTARNMLLSDWRDVDVQSNRPVHFELTVPGNAIAVGLGDIETTLALRASLEPADGTPIEPAEIAVETSTWRPRALEEEDKLLAVGSATLPDWYPATSPLAEALQNEAPAALLVAETAPSEALAALVTEDDINTWKPGVLSNARLSLARWRRSEQAELGVELEWSGHRLGLLATVENEALLAGLPWQRIEGERVALEDALWVAACARGAGARLPHAAPEPSLPPTAMVPDRMEVRDLGTASGTFSLHTLLAEGWGDAASGLAWDCGNAYRGKDRWYHSQRWSDRVVSIWLGCLALLLLALVSAGITAAANVFTGVDTVMSLLMYGVYGLGCALAVLFVVGMFVIPLDHSHTTPVQAPGLRFVLRPMVVAMGEAMQFSARLISEASPPELRWQLVRQVSVSNDSTPAREVVDTGAVDWLQDDSGSVLNIETQTDPALGPSVVGADVTAEWLIELVEPDAEAPWHVERLRVLPVQLR